MGKLDIDRYRDPARDRGFTEIYHAEHQVDVKMGDDTTVSDLNVPSELLQLLMDIGYVATGRGFQEQAAAIFDGVIAARPKSELPLIGLAVSKITFGNFLEASKILSEKALIINPNNGIAKCFLSMAVRALGGKKEADELLNSVANDQTSDSAAKKLAFEMLTSKTPADGKGK